MKLYLVGHKRTQSKDTTKTFLKEKFGHKQKRTISVSVSKKISTIDRYGERNSPSGKN